MNDKEVSFLVDSIEKQKGNQKIAGMSFVYRMDFVNPVNFHHYIDNKKDLLLVVHLKTGSIIAGFTEEAVNELNIPGRGFLASVTKQ